MRYRIILGLLAICMLAGCGQTPQKRVGGGSRVSLTVLPKPPDGHVGAVMVRPIGGGKPVLVNRPYIEARLEDSRTVSTFPIDPKNVNATYGQTLAALPKPPASFLVAFVEGTEELNPDAKRVIDEVVAEIATRPAPEIAVVGHTDLIGTDGYNDKLSLQRAERVRAVLTQRGIRESSVSVTGRGERDLLVPTQDGVVEAGNRRVEVNVR